MQVRRISVIFSFFSCLLTLAAVNAAPGDLIRTLPYPNPQAAAAGPYAILSFGANIIILTNPPDSHVYVQDKQTGVALFDFPIPTNSPPWPDEYQHIQCAATEDIIAISDPYDDQPSEGTGRIFLFDGTTGQLLTTIDNPDPEPHPDAQFAFLLTAFNETIFASSIAVDGTTGLPNGQTSSVYGFDGRKNSPTFGTLVATISPPAPNYPLLSAPINAADRRLYCTDRAWVQLQSIYALTWAADGNPKLVWSARMRLSDPFARLTPPVIPYKNDFLFHVETDPVIDPHLPAPYVLFKGSGGSRNAKLLLQIDTPELPYFNIWIGKTVAVSGNYILINGQFDPAEDNSSPRQGFVAAFDGRKRGRTTSPSYLLTHPQGDGRFGGRMVSTGEEIYITAGDAIYVYQRL